MDIIHEDFSLISYEKAMERQSQLHSQVVSGEIDAAIMTLQHPATLTLGKNASRENFLLAQKDILERGVEIVETDRGGEVTAHMPGQLVVYPIIPLRALSIGPKAFVNKILLAAVLEVLEGFGLKGHLDDDNPGVWVEDRKVCAVGVRISQRVSTHGIAINVNNDLKTFEYIVPCGIQGKTVSSLSQELGRRVELDAVKRDILASLNKSLGNLSRDT